MVVTENLTFTGDHSCSGNGLIVAADKVTIDLGGFTLSGDGGPSDVGIQIGSPTAPCRWSVCNAARWRFIAAAR